MDDRVKKQNAEREITAMLVEFLRALGAINQKGRDADVAAKFVDAWLALNECDVDARYDILVGAISDAIVKSSPPEMNWPRDVYQTVDVRRDRVISASSKVMAERISGNRVQGSNAENRLVEALHALDEAMKDLRNKLRADW